MINVGTKSNGNIERMNIIMPGEGFKVEAIFKVKFQL